MKTTVIPAQVTTVEDTIAGNLALTQIILLILPVLFSTAIYAVLPERMNFTAYKVPLMIVVSLIFITLTVRIKGRLVLHWMILLAVYALRPHLYLFNKNTIFARVEQLPIAKQQEKVVLIKKIEDTREVTASPEFDYDSLLRNTGINIRFTKKGFVVVKNI